MTTWRAELHYRTTDIDPAQVADHLAESAAVVHYHSEDHVLRLRAGLDGHDLAAATAAACHWADDVDAVLAAGGVTASPIRLTVEDAAAGPLRWAAGAHEAAEILGVSTARLRQLDGKEGFPHAVLELAGGKVYHADEIETWRRTRPVDRGGRPRKTSPDE
ncbi:hypothetical protein [Mangrovihabitans endophyticus]|uniref:Uncharacterized protein n=1 Tax=Mangrovihabitans endophyticus TaxID=1751298 RepID=A0A8J3BZU0_9ACTN|nr:hypothetical protein [Mangrovihabitans endophyticus]GGK89059.1 hypothetical protein GCM10012284_23880 [Mangrovihabitans endophyticus]